MSQNIIEIPSGTILEYRCEHWKSNLYEEKYFQEMVNFKVFGEIIYEGENHYLVERIDYEGEMPYMIKKQDLLPYLKEENYEIY